MNELVRLAVILSVVYLIHRLDRRAGHRAELMADSLLCVRCGATLKSDSTLQIPVSGYYRHTMGKACARCAKRDRRVRNMVMVPIYLFMLVCFVDMLFNDERWLR